MLEGNPTSSESKIPKKFWDPRSSIVEGLPNEIVLGQGNPAIMHVAHWHSQIEINYIECGSARYEMCGQSFEIGPGDIALFWGGLPHRLADFDNGTKMEAIHLPLLQFFRLRLPEDVRDKLMYGAALIATDRSEEDRFAFRRWCSFFRSGSGRFRRQAREELLLRLERIALETYHLVELGSGLDSSSETPGQKSFEKMRQILEYITTNFRDDIDATSIAKSAGLHPKYAMSVFKKTTGVTLLQYVQLLRLSYAQALLLREVDSILNIAMRSGFGSLSHFNRIFRKHTGLNPTEFKRKTMTNCVVVPSSMDDK